MREGVFYELEDDSDFYGQLLALEDFKKILSKEEPTEKDIIRFAANREERVIRLVFKGGIRTSCKTIHDPFEW